MDMINLSGNSVSTVWREGDFVFKRQPKYLTDNEAYALEKLADSGFVPSFERIGLELIKMQYVEDDPIGLINSSSVRLQAAEFLSRLRLAALRHGDLTRVNIRYGNNSLVVIDWGESRVLSDPRPDKRPEGDEYWLSRTITEALGVVFT